MRIILIFFILGPYFGIAQQDTTTWQYNLVISLSQYRNHLIKKSLNQDYDIHATLTRWANIEQDKEVLNDIINYTNFGYVLKIFDYKRCKKYLKNSFPSSALPDSISETELFSVIQNAELTDLILIGALFHKSPYRVHLSKNLIGELDFYNFRDSQVIAEIGSGNGAFSQLISMMRDNLMIYINEVDADITNYLNLKKANQGYSFLNNQPIIIKGTSKSINISEKVDKVIIRNSFHHFKHKVQMLESIKQSLKSNGSLYILERPKVIFFPGGCKMLMYEDDLKEIVTANGFKLISKTKIGISNLFEFGPTL